MGAIGRPSTNLAVRERGTSVMLQYRHMPKTPTGQTRLQNENDSWDCDVTGPGTHAILARRASYREENDCCTVYVLYGTEYAARGEVDYKDFAIQDLPVLRFIRRAKKNIAIANQRYINQSHSEHLILKTPAYFQSERINIECA